MQIFFDTSHTRRKYFRLIVIALLAFFFVCTALFSTGLLSKPNRAPVSNEEAAEAYHYYYYGGHGKKLSLTFDDGPHKKYTREILEVLKKHHIKATFFFIGSHVLAHPDVARDAAAAGHDIGNHSFTHSFNTHLSPARISLELGLTDFLLARTTAAPPSRLYRPPYLLTIGVDPAPNPYQTPEEANHSAMREGFLPVGIDIDSGDWSATSPAQIVATLREPLADNKHIVLMHDSRHTAQALDEVITSLKAQGYAFVPLRELVEPPRRVVLANALALGDTDAGTGGEVSKLQWFLFKQGLLDPYLVSGVFDEETRAALGRFQVRERLVEESNIDPGAFGVAGDRTRASIAAIALGSERAAPPEPGIAAPFQSAYISLIAFALQSAAFLGTAMLLLMLLRVGVIAWLLRTPQHAHGWYDPTTPVSVLIPAHNEAENIRSTLESVVANSHPSREIIVVDDGSTDATAEVVREVMARHPFERIVLISTENAGKASALNTAMEAASADILVVVDADAVLDRETLRAFVPYFTDERVGAVAGKVYATSGGNLLNRFQEIEYMVGQNLDKRAMGRVGAVGVVPGPAGAWRKSAIRAAGGVPGDTLVEDQDLTLSVLRLGYRIPYEPRAIAYTEAPQTVTDFLAQRFRWVFGTVQCLWKHGDLLLRRPSALSTLVLPNTLLYGVALPLLFPLVDTVLVGSIVFGVRGELLVALLLFTLTDIAYTLWGLLLERGKWPLMFLVPLQRVAYRALLFVTLLKSLVRALEGTGSGWGKFAKTGDAQRYYASVIVRTSQEATSL